MEMENVYILLMEQIRDSSEIIDLSYTMETNMPVWPTHPRYGTVIYESYEFGDAAVQSMISLGEHTGTHMDAPKHFIAGGASIDKVDVKTVMGRGFLIEAVNLKAKESLTLKMVQEREKQVGTIKENDIILIRFGWDDKYALQPNGADFLKDWPGLSEEAALYFLEKKVSVVGCDTLSLDVFGTANCVSHEVLLGNGIPIIENICNLAKLSPLSYVIGLPNKFKDGSGSPIRLVAFVNKNGRKEVDV